MAWSFTCSIVLIRVTFEIMWPRVLHSISIKSSEHPELDEWLIEQKNIYCPGFSILQMEMYVLQCDKLSQTDS